MWSKNPGFSLPVWLRGGKKHIPAWCEVTVHLLFLVFGCHIYVFLTAGKGNLQFFVFSEKNDTFAKAKMSR